VQVSLRLDICTDADAQRGENVALVGSGTSRSYGLSVKAQALASRCLVH